MATEQSSLEKAVEAEAGAPLGFKFFADPEQLDLLRDASGNLPADALRQVRKGPGRPKNSQNKASKDFARWFVGRYGDPADVFGEIMNMAPDVLYEQMKLAQGGESKSKRITGADVMRLKMQAAEIIMPYIHGKQPVKVDMTVRPDVILNIEGLTDTGALPEMAAVPEVSGGELERLEYVPAGARGVVEDAEVVEAGGG